MALTLDPDLTLEQLKDLRRAVIDSSSVIYAAKAGVLKKTCETLELWTVIGAVQEVGYTPSRIQILDEAEGVPVDDQIVNRAAQERIAVISEDRKIHMKADDLGIPSYNMLVILELLLLRGEVTLIEWDRARKRLLAAAQYGPRVVHAGNLLHWAVRKETG